MGRTIFVSANGTDENGTGTYENPFATVHKAVEAARMEKEHHTEINVREGIYFFEHPIVLGNQDSGLTIRNYGKEHVVFSGARILGVAEWSDYEKNSNIKRARIAPNLEADQLFVNGKLQTMCRYPNRKEGEVPLEGVCNAAKVKERAVHYEHPQGGHIRAIHNYGWGGNDYIITGKDPDAALGLKVEWIGDNNWGSLMSDEMIVVENVLEELDAPEEWFYDRESGDLYWYPGEEVKCETAQIAVSTQSGLIQIQGNHWDDPAENIHISGITFWGTRRTMFFGEKYIPLMRGDWCVVKAGAVYLENTKNVKISNSEFEEIGGNAVFFYGYNEGAQITENEFRRIGATAVQVIGSPKAVYEPSFWNHQLYPYLQVHKNEVEFPQCQGPACEKYPRDIIISENHIQGTGIYEKQSCGVNLSVASGIKILHNTIHNSARSCINVNDGSFGGHEIACNDIYDSQRETTDHGPFNSWGRDRFWSVPRFNAAGESGHIIRNYEKDGKYYDLSLLDAYQTTEIHNNRFHHEKNAPHSWGIDLDDGSSNYKIYNNLCLGLGIKLREGFERKVFNNIIIDGQIQIHVPYEEANDCIERNIIVDTVPFGFACVDEERLERTGNKIDYNCYYSDSKVSLPFWMEKTESGRDAHTAVMVNPEFEDPQNNNFTVKNEMLLNRIGFRNFPMDNFGKTGSEYQAPMYRYTENSRKNEKKLLQWYGAVLTDIDDAIMSATASCGYEGVFVEKIDATGIAYAMGLKERDIVKKSGGIIIRNTREFLKMMENKPDSVSVFRDNKEQVLKLNWQAESE